MISMLDGDFSWRLGENGARTIGKRKAEGFVYQEGSTEHRRTRTRRISRLDGDLYDFGRLDEDQ